MKLNRNLIQYLTVTNQTSISCLVLCILPRRYQVKMPGGKHRTYKIVLTNPSEGEVERLRCLVSIYDYIIIKSDQSTPGLRLVVGTAHSKSQRSKANLHRIFPQAKITIGDAFDFRVQRAYFADEIVTKKFCGIEKAYLKEGISTCGCGNKKCQTPHHQTFDCVNCQCEP